MQATMEELMAALPHVRAAPKDVGPVVGLCFRPGLNRREFPDSDGTLRFSRVGLDRSLTQALLYAGQQFDWSVGSGGYWLFSKSDGEWVEAGRVGDWIS